jgi:hypothetical protein
MQVVVSLEVRAPVAMMSLGAPPAAEGVEQVVEQVTAPHGAGALQLDETEAPLAR